MSPLRKPSRNCRIGLLGAAALLAALFAAPAQAATPTPAWSIDSVAVPTNFAPGDESGRNRYRVTVMNSGGAPTDGSPIGLTATLPAGLVVDRVVLSLPDSLRSSSTRHEDFGPSLCETESAGGVETVRCTVTEFAGEAPAVLGQGESLGALNIFVNVPAGVFGTLTNQVQVQGGGAPPASVTSQNEASAVPAAAGFSLVDAALTGIDGLPAPQAGSHPYRYTTDFAVNTQLGANVSEPAEGDLKDIRVELPPGLVGNPGATPRCTAQQFNAILPGTTLEHLLNECPAGSVVGLIGTVIEDGGDFAWLPIYNLVPPKGMPAQFGFWILGLPFFIHTEVRTGGDYGITASVRNLTQLQRGIASRSVLWGTPADPNHNPLRGACLNIIGISFDSCPTTEARRPFLRLPTSCSAPMTTEMRFDTWSEPGSFVSALSSSPAPSNCAPLAFSPTISATPTTTVADSPSGLSFNLHLPQSDDPDLLATADLKDAVVTLPEGVTVNPASAGGLAACTPAQIEIDGPNPASCPDASKVGSVEVHTPLLDHPVKGAVHVASQGDNPFGSLLAIYIAVHDPRSGVVIKLAGKVEADPNTGQLTTTFTDNPQLPFEDFTVEFFDGPRAALRTPSTCGTYTTTTSLKPWSAPESGPDATPSDSFAVTSAPGGGPCAASEAAQPNQPSFEAGTLAPVAGAYSPFVMNLKRSDGSQALGGLNVALPPGLVGRLAGTPYCPEGALAAAAGKSGAAEQASPSCPAASQVGAVDVGAGAGNNPIHVEGKVYLAGPYKGAPLSVAILTPALAGPFDLGTVVVRAALRVDPETAQVSAVSDPLPTILEGIPLALRSVSLAMDKPRFTLNPTNCEAMAVSGEAISLANQIAALSSRFQVGGCRGLGFKPRTNIRLFGKTNRGAYQGLRAVVRPRPGEANISRTVVRFPRSAFVAQENIRTICTRVQFAADACPKGSIYGKAIAYSPLVDYPLRGNVYLRSSDNALPDAVADLRGPAHQPIRIEVAVRNDSVKGALRNTVQTVPDAPVSYFRLQLFGKQKGLIVNSRNICRGKNQARVAMAAHNGRRSVEHVNVFNRKCKKLRRKAKRSAGHVSGASTVR